MDQKKGGKYYYDLKLLQIGNVFFLLKNAFTGFIACWNWIFSLQGKAVSAGTYAGATGDA